MFEFINWVLQSLLANFMVVAILGCTLVSGIGLVYLVINMKTAKTLLFNSMVGLAMVVFLGGMQLGKIPTRFDAIRDLGLATFPDATVENAFDVALGWVYNGAGVLSSGCMAIGAGLTIFFRGRVDWGPKAFIVGVAMTLMILLIGEGLLFQVMLRLVGLDVPVY